jgi:hypothetical protein
VPTAKDWATLRQAWDACGPPAGNHIAQNGERRQNSPTGVLATGASPVGYSGQQHLPSPGQPAGAQAIHGLSPPVHQTSSLSSSASKFKSLSAAPSRAQDPSQAQQTVSQVLPISLSAQQKFSSSLSVYADEGLSTASSRVPDASLNGPAQQTQSQALPIPFSAQLNLSDSVIKAAFGSAAQGHASGASGWAEKLGQAMEDEGELDYPGTSGRCSFLGTCRRIYTALLPGEPDAWITAESAPVDS